MKVVVSVSLAVIGFVLLHAPARADVIDVAIGNTVSVMGDDGVETRYYFNENGSVTLATSTGASDVGTWRRTSDQLCLNWEQNEDTCIPLPQGDVEVGGTFTYQDSDGVSREGKILADKVPF